MTIQEKFETGLSELVALCMDGGMSTFEMVPIVERELERLRRPYQNAADNAPPANEP
jgi:hypothetical protein